MKKEARGESDWEKGIMLMQTQVKLSSQIALIGFNNLYWCFFTISLQILVNMPENNFIIQFKTKSNH